jgi:hypothetical protein
LGQRWYAAWKRRLFFEGSDTAMQDHELHLPAHEALLPYRHQQLFKQIMRDEIDITRVRHLLCEAISHSDGIVDPDVSSNALCVCTSRGVREELAVFKRFIPDEFRCEVVRPNDSGFVEFYPNAVRLIHSEGEAVLTVHLDLFEILMRYREGYVPSTQEWLPFTIDLNQFKSRLLHLDTEELLLLESGRRLHRVIQRKGVVQRPSTEGVAR